MNCTYILLYIYIYIYIYIYTYIYTHFKVLITIATPELFGYFLHDLKCKMVHVSILLHIDLRKYYVNYLSQCKTIVRDGIEFIKE